MPHPIEIIKKVHRLDSASVERIRSMMREEKVSRGHVIDVNSQLQSNSYYIKKGAARVYYIRNGKEHTVSFAFDDDFIMSPAMFTKHEYPIAIMFIEDTDVIYVPRTRIQDMLFDLQELDRDEAALFLSTALIHYCGYLEERVFALLNTTAAERYEWALNRYPRLLECATITQIASFLGITKETLYRIRSGKYGSS